MITGQRLLGNCPPVGMTVESDTDVPVVRGRAAAAARAQGFDRAHSERVSLVATEMATDMVKNARSGRMLVQLVERGDLRGVELVATDGPGIDDIDRWNAHAYSIVEAPIVGLEVIARLSDQFDVYSVVGLGTVMMARLWGGRLTTASDGRFLVGSMTEAIPGEVVSGDAWAVEQPGARVVALVADGLGHGVEAAAASAVAVETFRHHHQGLVEDIVGDIHRALRGTRGAAIAVAEVDPDVGRVRFCGIGNISARLIAAGQPHELVSHFGIAGHLARRIQAFDAGWADDSLLVMHSDGLSAKWDLSAYRDLDRHHPQLTAATVMRDAPRAYDDALVLALRGTDEAVPDTVPEAE